MAKAKFAKSGKRNVLGSAMSPAKAGKAAKAAKRKSAAAGRKKAASQMKAFKKKYGKRK